MFVFCSAGVISSVIVFCHHSSLKVGFIFFRQAAQISLNAFFISYVITALQKECGQHRQTPANTSVQGQDKRVIHETGAGPAGSTQTKPDEQSSVKNTDKAWTSAQCCLQYKHKTLGVYVCVPIQQFCFKLS